MKNTAQATNYFRYTLGNLSYKDDVNKTRYFVSFGHFSKYNYERWIDFWHYTPR